MVSVVRCWKAEYQKCKHSILLYMHIMIPIICAAIFAGYYHISRWELATKISAYLEVLAVAFPFLIGIIVGLVVQIENQAGHLPDSFVCGNELRKRCIYGIGNCREFNSCPYDNRAW